MLKKPLIYIDIQHLLASG